MSVELGREFCRVRHTLYLPRVDDRITFSHEQLVFEIAAVSRHRDVDGMGGISIGMVSSASAVIASGAKTQQLSHAMDGRAAIRSSSCNAGYDTYIITKPDKHHTTIRRPRTIPR
jgi:hypothetical protein